MLGLAWLFISLVLVGSEFHVFTYQFRMYILVQYHLEYHRDGSDAVSK